MSKTIEVGVTALDKNASPRSWTFAKCCYKAGSQK